CGGRSSRRRPRRAAPRESRLYEAHLIWPPPGLRSYFILAQKGLYESARVGGLFLHPVHELLLELRCALREFGNIGLRKVASNSLLGFRNTSNPPSLQFFEDCDRLLLDRSQHQYISKQEQQQQHTVADCIRPILQGGSEAFHSSGCGVV